MLLFNKQSHKTEVVINTSSYKTRKTTERLAIKIRLKIRGPSRFSASINVIKGHGFGVVNCI